MCVITVLSSSMNLLELLSTLVSHLALWGVCVPVTYLKF